MKEFRTEIMPKATTTPVGLGDRVFTIGSCFADSIGHHFAENKFKIWNNMLGTVYNPISIHRLLLLALKENLPPADSYLEHEGIHFNYHFHSTYSALSIEELKDKISTGLTESGEFLKHASRVIITYGTALVYHRKGNDLIVANCHKMPSADFAKLLLTEREITESFQLFYTTLKATNPKCKIILTLSPVRHLKDTLELNAVSKSLLRLVCHAIVQQFPDVEYFPAYEILLDDLRDYRFYDVDRLHPTQEAVDYIWEKFAAAYLDEEARTFIHHWKGIKKDLAHQPFHAGSARHQKFLKDTLVKLEQMPSSVDCSQEIESLKRQVINAGNPH